MIVTALFGLLMIGFSIYMIADPKGWSLAIIKFSEKSYFHPFEIITRVLFGCAFIQASSYSLYPMLFLCIGYLLLAVGIGLLFTPPKKHKQFARWSATRFSHIFRTAGFCSLCFGVILVYAALAKL